jgi:hypothetical protein
MKRMRFLVSALIIWLFLFYNIERLSVPINIISSVAYTLVPIIAALTITVSPLRKVSLWLNLVLPIPIFLVLKAWLGYRIWGTALPLTVTEICAIALTTILARWVSNGLWEFESAIARITIGQIGKLPESFSTDREIYREVRRARYHQRPLALMAIGVEEESIQIALDRMVQEVQRAMMKQYVLSGVAKTLCDELEDYNVIAQHNNHFLALLPEVTPEKLAGLIGRLRKAVSEQVGVNLQIGTASFPEDAVTFESLVEKAVEEMGEKPEPGSSLQPQRLTTERHTV